MDKVTLLAHYTSLCKGDERKAIMMRNATINRLVLLVEGDITPTVQAELQEYCHEYFDVQYLIEHELLSKHGTEKSGELNSKLYYAMTIPPEDESTGPELKLVEGTSITDAHDMLNTAMEEVTTLAGDQLAWLGQQTEALATVQSQVVALNAMMQQLEHGMKPVQESVGETDKVAYNALVLVVGKLLPNTLLKTINQQRTMNQHVARKLIKASVQAGGDRKEKVLELFHGDIPDMTNW